jgi:hypothetical protein
VRIAWPTLGAMPAGKVIRPVRVNHVNLVLEDYDASLAHLEALYGCRFLRELPQPNWHACLVDIGRVIFELFVPNDFFLHSRFGPHHSASSSRPTWTRCAR